MKKNKDGLYEYDTKYGTFLWSKQVKERGTASGIHNTISVVMYFSDGEMAQIQQKISDKAICKHTVREIIMDVLKKHYGIISTTKEVVKTKTPATADKSDYIKDFDKQLKAVENKHNVVLTREQIINAIETNDYNHKQQEALKQQYNIVDLEAKEITFDFQK